ncbi:MAG TPA: polyprenyl synthetase family protein [Candidatus Omnitrophota bacterium]|nr:polyprenyl synthetase family protein [Candidatus Omnitrophota bacterium]
MNIGRYFTDGAKTVDRKLAEILPPGKVYPSVIHEAMRYSVFSGGKRIRPLLALASAEVCGKKTEKALLPACAIELFHTYSLIHDDLPCLDNDNYRRGKPTCHKKFGEANAVLAGDALLTLGFQTLGMIPDAGVSRRLVFEIARAIGTNGMIGGQVVDKETEGKEKDLPLLDYINVNKTGQLIRVSCLAGAVAVGAGKREELALSRFGEHLGIAFQVIDDIIDRNGYLKLMSETEARRKAEASTEKAKSFLQLFGKKADTIKEIADFILTRKY